MVPLVAANMASNVLGQATKITKLFGQSEGFKSAQGVRDKYYALLTEAGTYFASQGDAGKSALQYMNATYSDLSATRNYGKVGPTAADLQSLQTWLKSPMGTDSPIQAAVGGGLLTAKTFGVPLWAILAGLGVLAWVFFGRRKGV
jgi:hypothetical protein